MTGGNPEHGSGTATTDVVRERYDWGVVDPSMAVVKTIATLEDADPVELGQSGGFALGANVDPEAVDSIVDGHGNVEELTLVLDRYLVEISGSEVRAQRIDLPMDSAE